MATQIECSDELWVIRMTLICARESASNRRLEKPGMPTIPLPSRLRTQILSMLVMPRMISLSGADSASISVPWSCGREGIFYPDGDAARHYGLDRRRVDDLCAEVRELHRLAISDARYLAHIFYKARVGRHHPADIGPDLERARARARRNYSRRVIRTAAPESGRRAARIIGRDKAGQDVKTAVRVFENILLPARWSFEIDRREPEIRIGQDQLAGCPSRHFRCPMT